MLLMTKFIHSQSLLQRAMTMPKFTPLCLGRLKAPDRHVILQVFG